MPIQVKRLILIFALVIGGFILFRYLLLPESFYQFGHYRGKAIEEILKGKLEDKVLGSVVEFITKDFSG